MKNIDPVLAWFIAIVAGIVLLFIVMINTIDDDIWNKGTNGCYIHEVHENHFGPDTVTITELCPVKEN
jgi:hypothetical protein